MEYNSQSIDKQKIRGTVSLVYADNPAVKAIGGFKESPTAFRKCRICDSDIQTKVR